MRWMWSRDPGLETRVHSSSFCPGLDLGLETWWPRSWSWSRDLSPRSRSWFLASTNLLYLVSRPRIGLGLETACLVSTPVARSLAQTLSICHLWLPIVVISRPWSRDSSALEFSLSRSRSWDLMVKVLVLVLVSRPKKFLTTTVGEFLVVTVTMHFLYLFNFLFSSTAGVRPVK